jgi:hypothetical protein
MRHTNETAEHICTVEGGGIPSFCPPRVKQLNNPSQVVHKSQSVITIEWEKRLDNSLSCTDVISSMNIILELQNSNALQTIFHLCIPIKDLAKPHV